MTPREANVLLTKAALLDPRLRRDPEERVAQAKAWAEVLSDVSLQDALAAVVEHYRTETRAVMPADIAALTADMPAPDRTAPADGPEWLRARGIDPDRFQALLADGFTPTRALRELRAVES